MIKLSELIAVPLFFTFSFCCLNPNLFIILFERSQIFSRLTELSFFHPFTYIPMNKGAFGVHQIKLVVDAREYFSDCSGIADHANCTHDLRQITAWDDRWRLIINTAFES